METHQHARPPAVSILLPTYNRAGFLPQAFEAIRSQRFTDWELVIVDDGSSDDTAEVVRTGTANWSQPVRYVRQENQGVAGARNAALDLARRDFVAFFDSDDIWLPHHLSDCMAALQANPEVDWVYGASRVVDHASGEVLNDNSFYLDGAPRPFLGLRNTAKNGLHVITDGTAGEVAIRAGLYAGLQCSVMRRSVFEGYRFARVLVAEDQLLVVEALNAGRRLAYFDDVHVIYHVHGQSVSANSDAASLEKQQRVFRALAGALEELRTRTRLTPAQTRALDRRLSGEYFWNLGYVLLAHPGHESDALAYLWHGLRLWPTNLALWKTYLVSWLRVKTGLRRAPAPHTRSA